MCWKEWIIIGIYLEKKIIFYGDDDDDAEWIIFMDTVWRAILSVLW